MRYGVQSHGNNLRICTQPGHGWFDALLNLRGACQLTPWESPYVAVQDTSSRIHDHDHNHDHDVWATEHEPERVKEYGPHRRISLRLITQDQITRYYLVLTQSKRKRVSCIGWPWMSIKEPAIHLTD
ncbi:hypothetical protein KQX54_018365 [Cotesia glomerata]|uniref:Uncharacterized protein n=1 Tax=Cotesia glomerata TaxID=32391 RepID=A0AAV7IB40_COTGL|nr:hypothetical protein KQX54_018365 [Cotesia glomerata]